jgi:hypothetical protein
MVAGVVAQVLRQKSKEVVNNFYFLASCVNMYKFRHFRRNEFKLLLIFVRQRAKFSSGFRCNCTLPRRNEGCSLWTINSPRNVMCVTDIDASVYSVELRKRCIPVLLSSVLALLAFCSERPKGIFDNIFGASNFRFVCGCS